MAAPLVICSNKSAAATLIVDRSAAFRGGELATALPTCTIRALTHH